VSAYASLFLHKFLNPLSPSKISRHNPSLSTITCRTYQNYILFCILALLLYK
ncbi:hypothetical protein COCVIDRAFT_107036, partial [Bipolaris victoriae FI3]